MLVDVLVVLEPIEPGAVFYVLLLVTPPLFEHEQIASKVNESKIIFCFINESLILIYYKL